ncbi:MAG: pseudouridine synthase, partial [Spirochaeta sp.]
MEWHKLELGENDDNRRVDTILRSINAGEGLSGMFAAIRKGLIRLNGRKTAANARVSAGDILEIAAFLLPSGTAGMTGPDKNAPDGRRNAAGAATDAAGTLSAESPADSGTSPDSCTLPVPVLFESDHIIAVCKPVGMLVHDGDNSLDAHLQKYLRGRIKPSVSFRPGPLHRLDRNTSGVICFSKSLDGARWFSEQMQQGTIRKYYLAIVQGELPPGYQETWRDHLQRSSLVTSTSGTSGGTHAETRARRLGTAVRYKSDQPKDTHTLLGLR